MIDGRAAKRGRANPRGLAALAMALGAALVGHAVLSDSSVGREAQVGNAGNARERAQSGVLDLANAVSVREAAIEVVRTPVDRVVVKAESRAVGRRAAVVESPVDAFIVDVVRNLTRVVEGVDRGMIAARVDAALASALGGGAARRESPVDDDLARLVSETGRRAQLSTALASAAAIARATRVSDAVDFAVDLPRVAIRGMGRAVVDAVSAGGQASVPRAAGVVEIDAKAIDAGDAIRRQIKVSLGGVKACYERALKRNTRLAGRYVIRFAIGDGGRIEDEGLDEDSVRDVEMAACVRAQVRRWRFALKPASEPLLVSYGVSFAPDPAAEWSPR
jgi:hypothetical protein